MDPMGMKKIEHAIKQTESDLDDARVNAPGVGDPPVNWDRAAWFGSRLRLSSSGAGGVALTSLKGDQLQLKHNVTPDTTSLDADYGTFYLDDNWKLKKVKGTTEPAVSAIENLNEVGDIGTLTQTTGYLKKVSGVWELDTTLTSSTYNDDNVKTLLGSLEKSFWEGLDNLKGVIDDAIKAAKDALDALITGINEVLDVIGRTVGEVWNNIVAWVTAQVSRITDFATKVWESLTSDAEWIKKVVWDAFIATVDWVKENIWDSAKALLKSWYDWWFETDITVPDDSDDSVEFAWLKTARVWVRWVSETFKPALEFTLEIGKKVWSSLVNSTVDFVNMVLDMGSGLWNTIFDLQGSDKVNWRVTNPNNDEELWWIRSIRDMYKQVYKTIKKGISAAWEFIKYAGTSIWNWILGLGEPSDTDDDEDRNWLKIIHNHLKSISQTATDLWSVVTKFWDSIVANGPSWLKGLEEGFNEGSAKVREALSKGGSTLSADIRAVYDFFGEGFNVIFGKPTSTESPSVTGATTGDIDVKTFDLRRVDRIFFDSNDQISATWATPGISGKSGNFFFQVPKGKSMNFWGRGIPWMRFVSTTTGNNQFPRYVDINRPLLLDRQIKVGSFETETLATKATPGVFWLDGNNIKCYTGSKEVSLSDIGTGGGGGSTPISNRRVTIPIRVSSSRPPESTLTSWFGSTPGSVGVVISSSNPTQASQVTLVFKSQAIGWQRITMGNTLGAITTSGSNPTTRKRIMMQGAGLDDFPTDLNNVKGSLSSNSADGRLGIYERTGGGTTFCVFNALLEYPPYRRLSSGGTVGVSGFTIGTLGQLPNSDIPDETPATLDRYFGEDNGSMGLDVDTIYVKASGRWFAFSLTYGGERPTPGGGVFTGGDVPNPTTFKSLVTFEGGVSGITGGGSNTPTYTSVSSQPNAPSPTDSLTLFNQGGVLKYIKQGETTAVTIGGTSGGIPNPIDADLIPTINNDGTPKRNIGAEGKLWSNIWADFLNAKSFGAEFEGRFGIQETNPNVRNVAYPGENGTGENSDIFVLNKNGVLTARHRKKNSSGQWIADFEDFSLEGGGGSVGNDITFTPSTPDRPTATNGITLFNRAGVLSVRKQGSPEYVSLEATGSISNTPTFTNAVPAHPTGTDVVLFNKAGVLYARKKTGTADALLETDTNNLPNLLPDNSNKNLGADNNEHRWNNLYVTNAFINDDITVTDTVRSRHTVLSGNLTVSGSINFGGEVRNDWPTGTSTPITPSTPAGQTRIYAIQSEHLGTSALASVLDPVFGKTRGAIGVATITATFPARPTTSSVLLWIRLSRYWIGLPPSSVINPPRSTTSSTGVYTTKKYIGYDRIGNSDDASINTIRNNVALSGALHGRIWVHEESDDARDGELAVLEVDDDNNGVLHTRNLDLSSNAQRSADPIDSTTRVGSLDRIPNTTFNLTSDITHSGCNSAFGEDNGAIGFNIGSDALLIKVGGFWYRWDL